MSRNFRVDGDVISCDGVPFAMISEKTLITTREAFIEHVERACCSNCREGSECE